jgi:RNA polymerase sigma factor (sigma-70 family)
VATTNGYVPKRLRQSSINGSAPIEATATTRARRGRAASKKTRVSERELEALRPLGQRYVRSHFEQLPSQDAEDVVADVVERLYRRFGAGEPPRNLNALFFTAVHNRAIDLLRRRGRRPEVALVLAEDERSPSPEPHETAESTETTALVLDVLARIRPRYREAIALRFGVGLNTPEIAAHKQISVTAAKKLVNRAAHQAELELGHMRAGDHCPEAQQLIRNGLFSRTLAEGPGAAKTEALTRHLAHCGSCKSFLSDLKGLHELAGAALLTGSAAQSITRTPAITHHLSALASNLTDTAHAAVEKTRFLALRAGQHLSAADGASAGAITGTAKQVTAICATGAAAATCLATGVVGPGLAAHSTKASLGEEPAAQTSPATTTDTVATVPLPDPAPADPTATTAQADPVQQTHRESGLGQAASAPTPSGSRDFAAPATSGSGSGSGGGGSGGGGFTFEK